MLQIQRSDDVHEIWTRSWWDLAGQCSMYWQRDEYQSVCAQRLGCT